MFACWDGSISLRGLLTICRCCIHYENSLKSDKGTCSSSQHLCTYKDTLNIVVKCRPPTKRFLASKVTEMHILCPHLHGCKDAACVLVSQPAVHLRALTASNHQTCPLGCITSCTCPGKRSLGQYCVRKGYLVSVKVVYSHRHRDDLIMPSRIAEIRPNTSTLLSHPRDGTFRPQYLLTVSYNVYSSHRQRSWSKKIQIFRVLS
jgi:hypothetical protein